MLNFQEIFDLALELGRKNDPRSASEIDLYLKSVKKEYDKLEKDKKLYFDVEKLKNPYPDSRILNNGSPKKRLQRVLVGIDIEVYDLLLAKELERQGQKIDGVIAHHPEGIALVTLPDNMHLQEGVASLLGVPINVVEKLLEPRVKEVEHKLAPINIFRAVDAAKLLNIPFMCLHTVADNHVHTFVDRAIVKKKPYTVGDVMDVLMTIPEYQEASKLQIGPQIYAGSSKSRAGKVAVTGMTGGTEGSLEIYERYSRAGVGTIIEMHISDDRLESAKKFHLNVVMAGHMASDSLGMNLIMDQIEKKGVEIVACSGYIRVRR